MTCQLTGQELCGMRSGGLTRLSPEVDHKVDDQIEEDGVQNLVRHVGKHRSEGFSRGVVAVRLAGVLVQQNDDETYKAYWTCFSTMFRWAYSVKISRAAPKALSRTAKKRAAPRGRKLSVSSAMLCEHTPMTSEVGDIGRTKIVKD